MLRSTHSLPLNGPEMDIRILTTDDHWVAATAIHQVLPVTDVRTIISLRRTLFERADALAQAMQISRSRPFVLAVKGLIQHYRNRKLLAAINEACDDLPDSEEQCLRHQMRHKHRQMVEGRW